MEEIKIIMEFTDKSSALFQLQKSFNEEDGTNCFAITSDFEGVSKLRGGCYWYSGFENLSSAMKAMSEIIENSEKNAGKVDTDWLIETFGNETC